MMHRPAAGAPRRPAAAPPGHPALPHGAPRARGMVARARISHPGAGWTVPAGLRMSW